MDVLRVEGDGTDPHTLFGTAEDAEDPGVPVHPFGPVTRRIAEHRHEPSAKVGDDQPPRNAVAGDGQVGLLVEDLDHRVRGEHAVHTRVFAGHRLPEQPGVHTCVAQRPDLRLRERARKQGKLVAEEALTAEEQQLHVRERPAGAGEALGEGTQGGGCSRDDLGLELLQGGRRGFPGRRASDGEADVGHRGAVQRVQDEAETRVQVTRVEQIGDPVARAQPGIDQSGAERRGELPPFRTRVVRELRRTRGAATAEDGRFVERCGQQSVVAGGVGSPEVRLWHHRKIREVGHMTGQMSVELTVERRIVAREAYELRDWLNGHRFLLEGVNRRKGKADGGTTSGAALRNGGRPCR